MKEPFRILSAAAMLGYGFPVESFEAGMSKHPHLIAADAGSTDPGPYYLGAGKSFTNRTAVKRDLTIMIKAGLNAKIPIIIGSAGGSGAKPHLDWCTDIVLEIARDNNLHFKLALISADFEKSRLKDELAAGNISALDPAPELIVDAIDASTHIVAQMGVEPIIRALDGNPDVILAGRAYDPSIFAALPIKLGYDQALALHLGKILECAAICATPGSGSDCMFGTLYEDSFVLEPLNPIRACTTQSVAAHTLYEKSNPYMLYGPGGHLDLRDCAFIQETDTSVRVSGSRWIPATPYTIKLEGARPIGYRTVSIAGARDPIMISAIDQITEAVSERVADNFRELNWTYHLRFNIYGKNGVMGVLEPTPSTEGVHELGIVIEATADTQDQADTICSFARSTLLHYGYPGRRATAGNLAFPYSPSDISTGRTFVFSLYHLMAVADPAEPFPVTFKDV